MSWLSITIFAVVREAAQRISSKRSHTFLTYVCESRVENKYLSTLAEFCNIYSMVKAEVEAWKANSSSSCTNVLLWLTSRTPLANKTHSVLENELDRSRDNTSAQSYHITAHKQLVKKTYQNLNGVKTSRVLWEHIAPEFKCSGRRFFIAMMGDQVTAARVVATVTSLSSKEVPRGLKIIIEAKKQSLEAPRRFELKSYDYDQPADDYHVMLFQAKRPNFLDHGKLNLMRSVMVVPAKFSLIIEAEFYDSTFALEILSGTYEFPVPRDGRSPAGSIMGKDCSLNLKVKWKLPSVYNDLQRAREEMSRAVALFGSYGTIVVVIEEVLETAYSSRLVV
nr:aminoacyl-tRNA synthetase, class 1a, anticodon-binding [Tanacetum cinerariifolium]